jgi:hypothetical protein
MMQHIRGCDVNAAEGYYRFAAQMKKKEKHLFDT